MRIVLVRLSALGDIVHTWPLACALAASESQTPSQLDRRGAPEDACRGPSRRRLGLLHPHRPLAAATTGGNDSIRDRSVSRHGSASCSWISPSIHRGPRNRRRSCAGRERNERIGLARPWRRERLAGLAYTDTVRRRTRASPYRRHQSRHGGGRGRRDSRALAARWLLAVGTGWRSCPDRRLVEPRTRWCCRGPAVLTRSSSESTLAEVARGLAGDGLEVVVAWGPGEESRATAVVETAGHGVYMAPPTDLGELAALLGDAALVIGGDTGPVHLAASFGSPTLAVFLASDWRRNGPLGDRTAVVSGAADAACRALGYGPHTTSAGGQAAEILESARGLLVR